MERGFGGVCAAAGAATKSRRAAERGWEEAAVCSAARCTGGGSRRNSGAHGVGLRGGAWKVTIRGTMGQKPRGLLRALQSWITPCSSCVP